jgi:pantoate--beta-alanine ligase
MIICKHGADLAGFIENQRKKGGKTGFVPTMGALHAGHISLISQSVSANSFTVCSIFVNPTQFNNPKDFEKYPITLDKDLDLLEAAGCGLVFLPSVEEIYPPGYTPEQYDLGYLETVLEGKFRPGHFQGVCQVVDRLLTLVDCDVLYIGQKDYQQCMVISRLVQLKDFDTRIKIGETVREVDGLAMSSRNARLTEEQRKQAVGIFETLSYIKQHIHAGDFRQLKAAAVSVLTEKGFKVDYVELTGAELDLLDKWDGVSPVVALVAAFLDEVRLIDNMTVA